MRGLPAFGHFSNFILGQICNVLRLHIYEPERVVFGQGEQGTAWYIILKGSVSVQVSPTGKPEDSVVVARLQAGEGFGDLALVEDKPRAATILTTELCELVYVEKADYDRIIKFIHEREIQERCLFLRAVPIFQDWAQASLRAVAQVINWRTYTAGATILAQGDHVQELFIVKTGQCAVIKTFNQEVREAGTVRSRRRHVQLGMLGTFACFGAEAVIDSAASPTARYTIRAWSEGPVECAVMTAFDAKSKLRGTNLMLPFTEYNDETALSGLLQYQLEERKYARLRDTVIRGLLKEWSGDPNASVQSPTVVRGTKHPVDVVTLNRVKLETSGYT
ncbi:cyclic nucleotide-binding-like protein [Gaertneriomyces semiglobifer]|nr:cyclic nucleotide-binding-like protein [Gaertneriomyces semiglobifer]